MSSNPLRLQVLFDKYVAGNCSREELQEFWQLIGELDETDTIAEQMQTWWGRYRGEYDLSKGIDPDKTLKRVLTAGKENRVDFVRIHSRRRRYLRWTAAAAVIFLFLAAGLWYMDTQVHQTAEFTGKAINTKHRVLVLPDGTRVTVNLDTKLTYPPQFAHAARDVYLSGEAFFEVAHNASKPFRVHTGQYTTEVLGTQFNISAYPNNNNIRVTVTQGKVQVMRKNKVLGVLQPNEQIVIQKNTHETALTQVDAQSETQWKNEDLVFDNIALGDAARILGKKYNVDIRFQNTDMRKCRFTGRYLSTDGLDQVIDIICSVTGAEWRREGDIIWLGGTACN